MNTRLRRAALPALMLMALSGCRAGTEVRFPSGEISLAGTLTVPLLYVFGDYDPLLPVRESAEAYRSALARAGHPDWEVRVFAGADHGVRIRRGPDWIVRPVFAPGYVELLGTWLVRHADKPVEGEQHGTE